MRSDAFLLFPTGSNTTAVGVCALIPQARAASHDKNTRNLTHEQSAYTLSILQWARQVRPSLAYRRQGLFLHRIAYLLQPWDLMSQANRATTSLQAA